jgi:hypothetical protein
LCGFGAVHYYKVNEGGFEEMQNVDVEYIITLMTSCLFYTAYGDTVARKNDVLYILMNYIIKWFQISKLNK